MAFYHPLAFCGMYEAGQLHGHASTPGSEARLTSAPNGSFTWKGQEIRLFYLAEGAANVVYKLSARPGKPLPPPLNGMLLRLRKQNSSGLPNKTIAEHSNNIAILFGSSDVLHSVLWRLPSPDLVSHLNRTLECAEGMGARPRKRHGVYLDEDEPNAMLIADMSTRMEQEELIELKPKWLLQSPSAPPRSIKCRTCALKAMRQAQNTEGSDTPTEFCPLDLLSEDAVVLLTLLPKIGLSPNHLSGFKVHIQPLLQRLGALQGQYSRVGLEDFSVRASEHPEVALNSAAGLYEMALGMTLRDCSVFVRYTPSAAANEDEAEVQLADLDIKGPSQVRLDKWAATERQLIEGGWYEKLPGCPMLG